MSDITKSAEEYDRINNERAHMENLLCQRFNFLIGFFAAVIGGAFAVFKDNQILSIRVIQKLKFMNNFLLKKQNIGL